MFGDLYQINFIELVVILKIFYFILVSMENQNVKSKINIEQNVIDEKINGNRDELLISRHYDEKFGNENWYTGNGRIRQEQDKRSFEVIANYNLKLNIQVSDNILEVNNSIIADVFKEYGFYGERFVE